MAHYDLTFQAVLALEPIVTFSPHSIGFGHAVAIIVPSMNLTQLQRAALVS